MEVSKKQERQIAAKVQGRVQVNSGGTKFGGGDIHTDYFLIEAKTTTKKQNSFRVKKEWLDKAYEQAFEQGKEEGVLVIRFDPDKNEDYYILNDRQFRDYLLSRER